MARVLKCIQVSGVHRHNNKYYNKNDIESISQQIYRYIHPVYARFDKIHICVYLSKEISKLSNLNKSDVSNKLRFPIGILNRLENFFQSIKLEFLSF